MNKLLKSKALVGTFVMTLALFGFVFSANNAMAAAGEGTATINAAANATVNAGTSNVFTVVLTVGATGITAAATNPTFTIPTGFTAPTGTPAASAAAVTGGVDGNWFAVGAGAGPCTAVGTTATGQVITVDVTALGPCASTSTITLTYKGTSSTVGAATPLVISTSDSAAALAPIAVQPTITVASSASGQGTATVAPTSVVAGTSNVFTAVLTVGAAGISATADSPTFTIPAGFTAPSATALATAGAVTAGVDGNWSAVGTAVTCAVTTGTSTASGQVMTVDVTGTGCVAGNTITLTYKGTNSTAAAAAPLVIKTDDVTGGTAAAAIATPPTISVTGAVGGGTASVTPSSVTVSTSNKFTVVLTVGAAGIATGAASPTFTIPTGFTAPNATPVASAAAVTTDGMWFATGTGCTAVGTTGASGVITVSVSTACVSGNTITLTYQGTSPATAQTSTLLVSTDDIAGGTGVLPIAASPTITVNAVAVASPTVVDTGGHGHSGVGPISSAFGGTGTVSVTTPVTCAPGMMFSTTTGQPCSQVTPAAIVGCGNTNIGFSQVTGQSCATNTIMNPASIAGCGNSNTGFSTSTGQSCANNFVTATGATYNFGTSTLRNGSKGAAVMELQRFLNKFLNLGLVVDGKLGAKTIAVIKKWQSQNGLVSDGLVGPKTKAMMNSWAATH